MNMVGKKKIFFGRFL